MRSGFYPKTQLIDKYLDDYVECFPDIRLIAGGHETLHLPTQKQYAADSMKVQVALNHVSKLFQVRNQCGPVGFFIDSWQTKSDQYDSFSTRIIRNGSGQIVPLGQYLVDSIYGKRYITGEFDYFGKNGQKPYELIKEQITTRHVSGLTLNLLRAADNKVRLKSMPEDAFERVSHAVSIMGYRLVLTSAKFSKKWGAHSVALNIQNVGVSDMFADFYEVHFIVKDQNGNVVRDFVSPKDLREIHPNKTPLTIDQNNKATIVQKLGRVHGKVYLKIIDKKGIEYPLTLSNWGRQPDGSYYLGKI